MKKFLILLIIYFLMIPNVLALNKYKVTFIMDDNFKNTIEVEENETITPPEPIKEGYTLVGFTNNGVLFDFNTPITSDITLIPVWGKIEEKNEISEDIDNKSDVIEDNTSNISEHNTTDNGRYSDLSDELKYVIIGIPVVIVIAIKYFLIPTIKKNKENSEK